MRPASPGASLPRTIVALVPILLAGCASLSPGAGYPREPSQTLPNPERTALGRQFDASSRANAGKSAFRIINVGVDGLLMRLEMIDAAEHTLDLQYYIFRGDESGSVLTAALQRAADRGVRVRVLVDDGETVVGDEQVLRLSGHGNTQVRVFNPWAYRGHNAVLRDTEYLLRHSRLDYRMHNKLFIVDGTAALVGGRNIGDQYFQIDPDSQFADDDVFVAGPLVHDLSARFDGFWNSTLAIPAEGLSHHGSSHASSQHTGEGIDTSAPKAARAGFNYSEKLAAGEPFGGILAGRSPLIWANAQVVCDSPDKKAVIAGARAGSLMYEPVANAATKTHGELLMITPYFVPTKEEIRLLETRLREGVRVRVLTNSLESTPDLSAHSGYMHYRGSLLQEGVEFHEVRALPGNTRGSGQSARLSRNGNYGLHAKLFVFDREQLFIGSMNFDRRSRRLNTEIGLIIADAELSRQAAVRFDAMAQEENSYTVALQPHGALPEPARLTWRTKEEGQSVAYDSEPTRSKWRKFRVKLLSLLPLDPEL